MTKILVCDRYSQEALSYLQSQIECEMSRSVGRIPTEKEIHEAEVLLIRSRSVLEAPLLKSAKNLKLILSATSGFDHIDLKTCEEMGIKVMHTPQANVHSAAELTLTHMLVTSRKAIEAHEAVINYRWKDDLPRGVELSGKTVGIIGLGRVGTRVAQLAQVFGCEVVACDPYVEPEKMKQLGVEPMGMNELLRSVDILTLHTPLTDETRGMINRKTLELMPESAILINVSRGALVVEQDLVDALNAGRLAAAGLDVFAKEPPAKESPILKCKTAVLTPHVGAYTEESFKKAGMEAAEKVVAFIKENRLSDDLPPHVGWYR